MSNEFSDLTEALKEWLNLSLKQKTFPELIVSLAGDSDPGDDDDLRNSLEILRSMTVDEFYGLTKGAVAPAQSMGEPEDTPEGIVHDIQRHFQVFVEAVYAMVTHTAVRFKDEPSRKPIALDKSKVMRGAQLLTSYREGRDDILELSENAFREKVKSMLSDTNGGMTAYLAGAWGVADEAEKERGKSDE